MQSGVFIERNGILNHVRLEHQHQINPLTYGDFCPNLEALEPLQRLKEAGLILIATTNQPGLSLGHQARRDLDRMHALLKEQFPLDAIYVCPHTEGDHCHCRKPKPGLFVEASHQWRLNLDHSFVISDKWQDAAAAHSIGCTSLLLASPWNGTGHHDFIMATLPEITERILALRAAQLALSYPRQVRRLSSMRRFSPVWPEFAGHCSPL